MLSFCFRDFCTVCEVNFPTTFRVTSEGGTYSGSRNVVGKLTSRTVQNP